MYRLAWVVVFAGCYSPAPYQPCQTVCATATDCQPGFTCGGNGYCRPPGLGDCSPTQDATIAGDTVDAADPPDSTCRGQGFLRICIPNGEVAALADVVIGTSGLIDTDDAMCRVVPQPNGPDVCVRAYKSLSIPISNSLRGAGSRPLVIYAVGTISIAGALDVSSTQTTRGAGSLDGGSPSCTQAQSGTASSVGTSGSGGGAGGSLVTAGGGGGSGGVGGAAPTAATPVTRVRGGCPGASGAPFDTTIGGRGGAGGGAVYLVATSISLAGTATINASGAGGGIAGPQTGGGGGGSGGFIGLDAPTISMMSAARVFSSGGTGSTGGGATTPGTAGGVSTASADPLGVTNGDGGGDGGAGHSVLVGAPGGMSVMNSGAGGGGGGGGGGFIGHAGGTISNGAPTFRPPAVAM